MAYSTFCLRKVTSASGTQALPPAHVLEPINICTTSVDDWLTRATFYSGDVVNIRLSFTFKLARAGLHRITAIPCASPSLALPATPVPRLRPTAVAPHYWKILRARQITSMGRKRKAVEPEESSEEAKQADESMSGSHQAKEAGPSPAEAGPSSDTSLHVNPKRYRQLKSGEIKKGPVIYWYIECKQHNCCVSFQAYQLRELALGVSCVAAPHISSTCIEEACTALVISVQMWLVAGCQGISV